MPICVVQGCHYRRGQKSRKQLKYERETGTMVTLHRFPKDQTRRMLWIEALTGWVDRSTENCFICSTHFTDECWEQSSVNRRLKPDAIPTLFPQGIDVSPVSRKRRRQIKEEPMDPCDQLGQPLLPDALDGHPPLNSQEPEVLLTELHRAEPVVPVYYGAYDNYPPPPPPDTRSPIQ